MRIGLDIASLANKHQISQIVPIAGDSDFAPAAKYARREGIDFILDSIWRPINDKLNKHIGGLRSCTKKVAEVKRGSTVHGRRWASGGLTSSPAHQQDRNPFSRPQPSPAGWEAKLGKRPPRPGNH